MYNINKNQDNLSTTVTRRDLERGLMDKNGGVYSEDVRRLLICKYKFITNYAIKEGTEIICSDAFRKCRSLVSIKLPNSVTTIGREAFRECTSLTKITIPEGVTTIEKWAFIECTGLTEYKVSEDNPYYCDVEGVMFSKDMTKLLRFPINSPKTTYNIPTSVTTIEEDVFRDCKNLTEINIPTSVTTIGSWAFAHCMGLTSLTIPDSVTTIEEGAFAGCTGLTGELKIPDSVTTIGEWAFNGCTGLTSIDIPNNVTTIGFGAFGRCTRLRGELKIPNSVKYLSGFDDCIGLTSVVIPNSVTKIGGWAFRGCWGLTGELKIPNSVTEIGSGAFERCKGLTGELKLPNSLISIELRAFWGCTGFTGELKIPDSVATIGVIAFEGCTGLTSLTLGNTVNTIGNGTFSGCTGLMKFISLSPNPPKCREDVFTEVPISECILYVPKEAKVAYESAIGWSEFKNIEEIDNPLTSNSNNKIEFVELKGVAEQAHVRASELNGLRRCVSSWKSPDKSSIPCFSLYYYYPTTCGWEVNEEDWDIRRLVWNFKASPNDNQVEAETKRLHEATIAVVIPLFKRVLTANFGNDVSKLTLCCIPASTKSVTEKRYKDFSEKLCSALGMTNGYDYVRVSKEGEAKHTGGGSSAEFSIDSDFFRDKYVILFDDIITSGRSMEKLKRMLERVGAKVIAGLSIGKTAHHCHDIHPIDEL